jgi:hypothetical protein
MEASCPQIEVFVKPILMAQNVLQKYKNAFLETKIALSARFFFKSTLLDGYVQL